MTLFALLLALFCTTQPLRIVYQSKSYYPIQSHLLEHTVWIRLSDFASALKFSCEYDESIHRMEMRSSSHRVIVHGENPFVKVDGRLVNLPQEIRMEDGSLFVSVPQLQIMFGDMLKVDFVLDRERRQLRLFDRDVRVERITLGDRNDTTELLIRTSAPIQFSTRTKFPRSLVLELPRGVVKGNLRSPRPRGLIEAVRIAESSDEVILEVSAHRGTRVFLARELVKPPGVSVIFVGPRPPPRMERDPYGTIRKIVIDPGHGGKDPGAVGPSGLLEKNVNLEISKTLKKLLEDELQVEIIMTRDDDRFVSLNERARIANEASADLFISVHCNSAPRRKKNSGGAETYFLSVAKTDEARAVEARENASLKFETDEVGGYNSDDVSLILWDLAQNEFLEESAVLAEAVQKEIARYVPIEDRGINQAGFFVLNGVYMPSILIECAFISNEKEEELLMSRSFREKLVRGIVKGIAAFRRQYEARSSS
jgi:N-acetylmuramoyl-L-alanine amidase